MSGEEGRLALLRRAYAMRVLAAAGVSGARLADAFAAVPRERFLGPGPWPVMRWNKGYVRTPDDDPVYVYDDVLVALDEARGLNNGQPSFHAVLLAALAPRAGDHVVHIGCGTGYYTAILAELVGPDGKVTGIEHDPELARRAAAALDDRPNVEVWRADATTCELPAADGLYVNAGVPRPPGFWFSRLRDGGRAVVPLTSRRRPARKRAATSASINGVVFCFQRCGDVFSAQGLSPTAFFPCQGFAEDAAADAAIAAALDRGGWEFVRSLHLGRHAIPFARAWVWFADWCLAYDPVPER